MGTPTGDTMYLASAEALATAAQLGAKTGFAHADSLRQQVFELLRTFVTRCRDAGIPDTETAEARYAIVAFVDDQVLKSDWPGRAEWQNSPLQLHFFREFAAGENFFHRMRGLTQRQEPMFALEVYYLCLSLGFVGARSAVTGPHVAPSYIDAARAVLLRKSNVDAIAPNAIPVERHRARARAFPVAWAAVVTCACVCLLGLVGLQFALGHVLGTALGDLADARRDQGAASSPSGAR